MPGGFGPDNAPLLSAAAVGSAVATVIDVGGEPVSGAPEALHDSGVAERRAKSRHGCVDARVIDVAGKLRPQLGDGHHPDPDAGPGQS